jgi:hypothetical protein
VEIVTNETLPVRSKAAFLPITAVRHTYPPQRKALRLTMVLTFIVSLFIWFLGQGSDPVLQFDGIISHILASAQKYVHTNNIL